MILVVDVGNSNTVFGVYKKEVLAEIWRIQTGHHQTGDELGLTVCGLMAANHISAADIQKTVIASVVPSLKKTWEGFCRKYLQYAPYWAEAPNLNLMPVRCANPAEVGADRLVNAIAAYHRYQTGLIVIDFGTATTFDVVSEAGEFLGGAISPGIGISADALHQRTAKLPRLEVFSSPPSAIGRDTMESIRSGVVFGYAGLVDGMVRRIRAEMASELKVIATGGLAPAMQGVSETIAAVEPDLTLKGLKIIADRL